MFFLLMCAICLAVLEKAKQDPTAGSTSIGPLLRAAGKSTNTQQMLTEC